MNEGEFSGGQVQPTPNDQGNMPEQSADTANQAILSSADAGATESAKSLFSDSNAFDAPQGAISSSSDSDDGGSNPGHLFGNRRRGSSRRVPAVEPQPFVPNPNAPDFFNDAMAAMTPTPQPSSNKKGLKIAVIVAIAVLLIGGGVLAAVLLGKGGGGQKGVVTAEKAKEVLNKEDVLSAIDFESEIKAIIINDREDDSFFSQGFHTKLDQGFAAYKKVYKGIEGYDSIRISEGDDGVDASVKGIAKKMAESIPVYEKIMDRHTLIYNAYINKDAGKLDSIDDAEAREAAKEYYDAVIGYDKFIKEKYSANKCDVEPDDMSLYPPICLTISDELNEYEDKIYETASKSRIILAGGIDTEPLRKNFVSEDLTALTAKLFESEDANEK